MRRAVQLGQMPRDLQENATTISSRHVWHRTRANPFVRSYYGSLGVGVDHRVEEVGLLAASRRRQIDLPTLALADGRAHRGQLALLDLMRNRRLGQAEAPRGLVETTPV